MVLAPCVPQARPRIGQPFAFPIKAPITLCSAFFRWAALVLHFDGTPLFGGCAGRCYGGILLGRGLRAGGGSQQAQCHAGTQDGAAACALNEWVVQSFVAIGYMHEGFIARCLVGLSGCLHPLRCGLPFSTPILPCAKLF